MSFITKIDKIAGITKKNFLHLARMFASSHGYNPNLLNYSDKKLYKLNYDGVHFGSSTHLDYITYLFMERSQLIPEGEALIHRDRYLKRSGRIRGDWQNNILSKNNLSRKILWNE